MTTRRGSGGFISSDPQFYQIVHSEREKVDVPNDTSWHLGQATGAKTSFVINMLSS